jgi:hypothetical protein
MRFSGRAAAVILAAALLRICSPAGAALITEYFNNYGESNVEFTGSGTPGAAGSGWAGGWIGGGGRYLAGSQRTASSSLYSNAGNEADTGDGMAQSENNYTHKHACRVLDAALTGTVWISAVTDQHGDGDRNNIITLNRQSTSDVWANGGIGATDFIWFGTSNTGGFTAWANLGDATIIDSTQTSIDRGVNLFLARIEIDYNGEGHDRIEFWSFSERSDLNPLDDLSKLATPMAAVDGADVMSDLNAIGFAGRDSRMDQLRISHGPLTDAEHVQEVLSGVEIPEPGSAALLAAGGLALLVRRRERT